MVELTELAIKIDAKEAIAKIEGLREAIDDIISHAANFRNALTMARDNAEPASHDTDDPGYWQHEIDVFNRIVGQVSAVVAEDPNQQDLFAAKAT